MYTGNLVTAASPGGPQLNSDLAGFANVVLFDNGTNGDAFGFDGVWSGIYNVPDLGLSIAGGKLYGQAVLNSVISSNGPLQSVVSFAIDAVRPNIETINFTTNRTSYNGVMYLSSLSQGTTTPNPNNAQGRFDITVNKRGTQVDIVINSSVPKQLSTLIIPPSATNPSG